MRQSIVTKFLGPTNQLGARIVCRALHGRQTHTWDRAMDVEANHRAAAHRTATAWGWLDGGMDLVGGGTPDGRGFAFVIVNGGQY